MKFLLKNKIYFDNKKYIYPYFSHITKKNIKYKLINK